MDVRSSSGSNALPRRTALDPVADEAFDRIASLVQRVLGVPVGLVSLVDRDRQVFPGQAGLPQPWSDSRCTPLTHSFCQYVVRSGEPLVVPDARLDPLLMTNLAIVDLGVVGYAGIPLTDLDGTVVGSLCAIDTEPHDWTPLEIALLDDLAATCSAELQLRSAAVAASESQARTRALLELSETLSRTLTTAEISEAVGKLAISRLNGSFGGITLLDGAAGELTYVELGALPAQLQAEFHSYPLTRALPSSDVVRTGQALYFEDLAALDASYPEAARALESTEARSAAYLPLRAGDRTLGTAAILWSHPRPFTDEDRALLTGLSSYTAQAVERALLLADRREVAETLQAAMLPVLPHAPIAELAARYYPARVADAVGGDWYDAFELAGGTLALSVGDVEGHDTAAAAVMGQLRAILRGLAIATPGRPDEVMAALDRVLASQLWTRNASGILASLTQQDDGTALAWTNAGHPPPLLLAPGRPPVYLEGTMQRFLSGAFGPAKRSTDVMILPPNSTLLLFTDGLVERRQADLDDSLDDLAQSAGRHRELTITGMVDAIVADMLTGPQDDDVVILGVRIPG